MTTLIATFDILSFWRIGTGHGEAGTLDSLCARDELGLPVIPGRSVRGLFREAVREATALGWLKAPETETRLFGTRLSGTNAAGSTEPAPGMLRFDDARLPDQDRAALAARRELIAELFAIKRSTAMIAATGTARPHSLRFDEVALPVTLRAEIATLPGAPVDAARTLKDVSCLIRALGSQRTRGLGRVIVTVAEKAQ
jgi:hypothetical protein